ncbi:MAG: ArsA-related P-loop ATPase [Pseudomonadota bacterium]
MTLTPVLVGKRILICAGTGGVGKTSISAALGLGAARRGQRVLVLTIDPSQRLAEALGVHQNTPEPVSLGRARERAAGIEAPGALSIWVLDPKRVSDQTVRRLARSPEEAARLMANPIYEQVTTMIAGMQEYTAMEALHGFVDAGAYDLVVLDTPPSRNALNFLEAPTRLKESLDTRIVELMLAKGAEGASGPARRLLERVLGGVFGQEFFADLQVFFGAFGGMLAQLNGNAQRIRARLSEPDTAFLLIAGASPHSLEQLRSFEARIRELGLPLGAVVLNRSAAPLAARPRADEGWLPAGAGPAHRSALEKLGRLAAQEEADIAAAVDLAESLGRDGTLPVVTVPELGRGVDDVEGLVEVSRWLLEGGDGLGGPTPSR